MMTMTIVTMLLAAALTLLPPSHAAPPAAPPAVAPLGSYGVANATRHVYAQGLTCLTPAATKHGVNRSQCGWQIMPAASRTNYSAMDLTLDAYLPSNDPHALGQQAEGVRVPLCSCALVHHA